MVWVDYLVKGKRGVSGTESSLQNLCTYLGTLALGYEVNTTAPVDSLPANALSIKPWAIAICFNM